MSGHPHPITRWLRLLLACLALAWGGVPAHAQANADVVVAVSVQRRTPEAYRPVVEAPARAMHLGQMAAVGVPLLVRAPLTGLGPETLPPGPPRRLFLAHRALLR
jgi:hypothetical protein